MKRKNILALGLSLVLLASCGMDSFGKVIDGVEDFLAVAMPSDPNVTVAKTYLSFNSTKGAPSIGEEVIGHSAELFEGMDFVLNSTVAGTSVSITGFVKNDIGFILTSDKAGVSSKDKTFIDSYRDSALDLISSDYGIVNTAYEGMKSFIGHSSGEVNGINYSSIYLATSVAGNTAGYTMKATYKVGDITRTVADYITLDKVGDSWAFTYYSRRIKDVSPTATNHYVIEYSFSCLSSLEGKKLKKKDNLDDVTFTCAGLDDSGINPSSGLLLTGK